MTIYLLLSAEAGFSAADTLPGVERCDRFRGRNCRVRVHIPLDEAHLDERAL